MIQKKLLVLDVNGFLLDTYFKNDEVPNKKTPDAKVGNFFVYRRPFCEEFLQFCLDNFVVGVWSSARSYNVNNLVDFAFGDKKERLAFIWHQYHCTDVGLKSPDNKFKPLFFKELCKLWNKTISDLPWNVGGFGPSNTLLVDDTPYKAMLNPPNTAIFPHTYTIEQQEDNFLGVALRRYLEGIRDAMDVQNYVKCNPFGAPGISSDNPLWRCVNPIILNVGHDVKNVSDVASDTVQNVGLSDDQVHRKRKKQKRHHCRVIEVGPEILEMNIPSEAVELECTETNDSGRPNKVTCGIDKHEEQDDKDVIQGHMFEENELLYDNCHSHGKADGKTDVVHDTQKAGECFHRDDSSSFERDQKTSKFESNKAQQHSKSDERADNNSKISVDDSKVTVGGGTVDAEMADKVLDDISKSATKDHHRHRLTATKDHHHHHRQSATKEHHHHRQSATKDHHHHRHRDHRDHQEDRDRDYCKRHYKKRYLGNCLHHDDRDYYKRQYKEGYFGNGLGYRNDRRGRRGESMSIIHEQRHPYTDYEHHHHHHHTRHNRKYDESFDRHKAANDFRKEPGYGPPDRNWVDTNHLLMPLRLQTSYAGNFSEPSAQQWNSRVPLHGQQYFDHTPNQVLVDPPTIQDPKFHNSTVLRMWSKHTQTMLPHQPDASLNQGILSNASSMRYESWNTRAHLYEGYGKGTRWDKPMVTTNSDRSHSQIESSHISKDHNVAYQRWKSGHFKRH